jgi:hypothetical protein
VEAAKELPARSVQKPPWGVGEKQFPVGFSAAPAAMVKKPAGLRTRVAWKQLGCLGGRHGRHTWAWRSAVASGAARHGVHCHAVQEISQRAQHLCAIGKKTAVKIHHAKKTLQLFDVLRGGRVQFRRRDWQWGPLLWPRISKEGTAKTHFPRLMARPLVARASKKASKWQRCVCLSGEPTRESSMYANTPSRLSVVQSIIC